MFNTFMTEALVRKPITSFRDLEVYQNSYRAMVLLMTKVLPTLPSSERYDLKDQLSRSCKAIPRLIAEGYAKRHQRAGFQKYLDDAMGECNETVVGLETCCDIYPTLVDQALCHELLSIYDTCGRQMYRLAQAWTNFKEKQKY